MTRYLTPRDVADELQVSVRTVRRLCNAGDIQHARVGSQVRIPREALDDYLETAMQRRGKVRA